MFAKIVDVVFLGRLRLAPTVSYRPTIDRSSPNAHDSRSQDTTAVHSHLRYAHRILGPRGWPHCTTVPLVCPRASAKVRPESWTTSNRNRADLKIALRPETAFLCYPQSQLSNLDRAPERCTVDSTDFNRSGRSGSVDHLKNLAKKFNRCS